MDCQPNTDAVEIPGDKSARVECINCGGHLFCDVFTLEQPSYAKVPVKQTLYRMCIKCRNIVE